MNRHRIIQAKIDLKIFLNPPLLGFNGKLINLS